MNNKVINDVQTPEKKPEQNSYIEIESECVNSKIIDDSSKVERTYGTNIR